MRDSTTEEFQIQIKVPPIPSPKTLKNSSRENKGPRDKKPSSASGKESRAEFDGGCWEMINQDAIQILPPKPKIPTKPTTSCIKPTFSERQKKGRLNKPPMSRISCELKRNKMIIFLFQFHFSI